MSRQQRGVVADPAEPGGGERILADPGVAVGGDDKVGVGGDLGGDHELRIGLHHHLDSVRLRGRGEAILGIGHHDAYDRDAVFRSMFRVVTPNGGSRQG